VKVLLSWLRDFVDVPGTAEGIGRKMSLRGLALEGVEPVTLDALPLGAAEEIADAILDFEVTANRPDNLSVIGIAREIATAYGLPLRVPGPSASGFLRTPELRPAGRDEVTVAIEAPDLCARYAAAAVEITPGPSPVWMQARLRALDVRPISNIVDITNYVLLEMGQPLHAFDATKLAESSIVVRRARPGETLTTLDGKSRALTADMLVIADAARASAIAGVMGGADSEVTAQTRKVILESAWFKPQSVRATSKALGMRTEASYRFERGADLTGTARAMARATALVELTGAGTASGTIVDVYPTPHVPSVLTLTAEQINGLLGMDVPHDEVERILASLGFDMLTLGGWHAAAPDAPMPVGVAGSGWQVTVPGWRVDIARPVDLVEEVGRHHGFEHLPSTFPGVEQAPPPSDWRVGRDQRVRRTLLASGFSEAVTFAFIEEGASAPFAEDAHLVRLANPLSEKFAVMRPSLIPGLIDAVSHNRRRERRDIRLFEIGTRFSSTGEVRAAAFAWTGLATPDHWSGDRRDVDFFDVKGVVEQLCATLNVTSTLAPASAPFLVDGRAAEILIGNHLGSVRVGIVGLLDSTLARAHDVPDGDLVYVAELDLDALSAYAPSGVRRAEPLPRHPSVVRDIAILIDDGLSAESVRGTIQTAAPPTLVGVREFDRYQGKGIPEGKVSLALRLTFQAPDRTLTDEEVQTAMDRIAGALRDGLGAVQR
jgi:phenylalanyl-tRNA synthetase beta chain